ncbi:ParB N-terminal domain-containing protein [Agrobacterium salinitolerans]|nr:ParB N-terminal domain-containing protein [Agrobacterium salinitolerans]MCZ7893303.1 ParB N-terminal domain-containing protein [Agrobacterium salinitolerans]
MANFKTIPLSSIHLGERARPVDEDHALAIASSMAERGLINPVTVRPTPNANNGTTPYTLVAGAHRLRGAELNQWHDIDAIVVSADGMEAQLIELSENLFRNELSALDRAIFVMKYREIWEEKHGKITRGRYKHQKASDWPFSSSIGQDFSQRVQNRLGFGKSTFKVVNAIGQNLHPQLRQAVRGTPTEDDQLRLHVLSKLPLEDQIKIASAMNHGASLETAVSFMSPPKPNQSDAEKLLETFMAAWRSMDLKQRHEATKRLHIEIEADLKPVESDTDKSGPIASDDTQKRSVKPKKEKAMTAKINRKPISSGPFKGFLPCLADRLKKENLDNDDEVMGLCRQLEGQEQVNVAYIVGNDFRDEVVARSKIMIEAKRKSPDTPSILH